MKYYTLKSFVIVAALARLAWAKIIFQESFEQGNLKQWDIQACPKGVTISTDVARTGTHSAKFTVSDNDTDANCKRVPTDNPRAQLVSDSLFGNGAEYYIAFSVYFPQGFPRPTDWFQIFELYGPPYGGSPTMGVDICNRNHICFQRDASYDYDDIWVSSPIVRGAWRDLVLHMKFSTDPNTGFVEIWDGGVKQKLSNGHTRVHYDTLNSKVNWDGTPNSVFLNQYRSAEGKLGTVTIYQDAVKVGTSLAEVMP